jgi:hypothetical protein
MNPQAVKFTWPEEVSLPQPGDDWRHVVLGLSIDRGIDVYEIQLEPNTLDEYSLNKAERAFVMEEIIPMLEDEWIQYMDEHGGEDVADPAKWVEEAGLLGTPDEDLGLYGGEPDAE